LTITNMAVVLHPPYFSVSLIEDKTKRPPFWHSWDDRGRIGGDAEHPHRTRLPGWIFKMAQALGTVHTHTSKVASRTKVSFDPDGSTSPGNYGCLFVHMQTKFAVLPGTMFLIRGPATEHTIGIIEDCLGGRGGGGGLKQPGRVTDHAPPIGGVQSFCSILPLPNTGSWPVS
jgi:hypothetical protein